MDFSLLLISPPGESEKRKIRKTPAFGFEEQNKLLPRANLEGGNSNYTKTNKKNINGGPRGVQH